MTTTGTGYSNKTNSAEAGMEAALQAQKSMNGTADFMLVFSSGKYDQPALLAGIKSVSGDAVIAGGAALGVFNNDHLSYDGYECAILAIQSNEIKFLSHCVTNIHLNEEKAGENIGKWIAANQNSETKGLFVFYETAKTADPPMLNFATPLFNSIEKYMNPDISCAGSGLLSNMQLTNGFQYFNGEVVHQSAVAILIEGKCELFTTIMHGCKPASSYHVITRSEGPVIFEIDNKPALDAVQEMLGPNSGLDWKSFPLFVTLGVNRGDKFGPFHEQAYANRLCLAVLEEQKALVMFEPDLKPGDEVQLMHRSVTLDYLEAGVQLLQDQINKKKILFYFYINCAGRAMPYAGSQLEDADELRKIIGSEIPFMGFYSGVEIAKVGNHLQALDWTGVLCALAVDK